MMYSMGSDAMSSELAPASSKTTLSTMASNRYTSVSLPSISVSSLAPSPCPPRIRHMMLCLAKAAIASKTALPVSESSWTCKPNAMACRNEANDCGDSSATFGAYASTM